MMNLKELINDYANAKYALGMHHERSHETCALPPLHVVKETIKVLGDELKHFLHCIDTSRIPKPPVQTEPLEKVPHTPEEWEVSWCPGDEYPDVLADGWPILLPRDEVPNSHRGRTLAEAVANARLVAAAPRILESLRNLLSLAVPGMNWTDEIGQTALLMARTAINEAEGKE